MYKKTGRATSEASGLYTGPRTIEPSISVEEEVKSNIGLLALNCDLMLDPSQVELRNPRRQPADIPLVEEDEKEIEVGAAIERKRPMTKEDIQKMNLKKKTRKRTRKFEIDGVTVTTTTSKVIYRDEESETFYDEHYFRKQVNPRQPFRGFECLNQTNFNLGAARPEAAAEARAKAVPGPRLQEPAGEGAAGEAVRG